MAFSGHAKVICDEIGTHHMLYPVQKRIDVQRDTRGSVVSIGWTSPKGKADDKRPNSSGAPIQILEKIKLEGISRYRTAQSCTGKVFWMILVITTTALLIRGICKNAYDYYFSPIATTYTITTPPELKFPDVYVCMGNAFSRSYLRTHPGILADSSVFDTLVTARRRKRNTPEMEIEDFPREHLEENLQFFESFHDDDDSELAWNKRFARATASNAHENSTGRNEPIELYDIVSEAGFRIPSTFLKCSFFGHETVTLDCNRIVRAIIDPNYFMCYVIDVPDEYKQVKSQKGLSLIINSQISDYPIGVNDTKANAPAGLYVSVTDNYDPTNWYKTVVRPGYFTKLDLAATRIQLINLERGSLIQPCVEDGTELYKVFNTSYSRTACQMDCFLHMTLKTCGCILMMDRGILKNNILENATFCSFKQSQTCVNAKVIHDTDKIKEIDSCREVCNTRCDSIRYEMRSSRAQLTNAIRNDLIKQNKLNLTSIPAQDLIRLDIAFSRMEYAELVQTVSKTVATMISDMGGTLNFWLGASLIALIDVFLVLTGTICYLCSRETLLMKDVRREQRRLSRLPQ